MVKKSRILKNYSLTLQKKKSNNLPGQFNVWSTGFQSNENRRINHKFLSSKLNRFRYGGLAQMVEQLAGYTTRYQESDLHLAFILLNHFTTSTYSASSTLLLLLLTY